MGDFLCPKCGEPLTICRQDDKDTATGVCVCGHFVKLVHHPYDGWLIEGEEPDVRWGESK